MGVKFALAIPHTPWIPERVESLNRLVSQINPELWASAYHVFGEQEPNYSWSRKLWRWGAEQDVTHLVQLQDDVTVAPNFWKALGAMVTARPDDIIGMQSAHPAFVEFAKDGVRWCKTQAWMVGVGYVIPMPVLRQLVDWRDAIPVDLAQAMNEDDLLGQFAIKHGLWIYHPIPTIIDHDTTIASSYANDNHRFRRPLVTWRKFPEHDIEDPEFWAGDARPVTNPHLQACWGCNNEYAATTFGTGLMLGRRCVAIAAASLIEPSVVKGHLSENSTPSR